MRSVQPSLWKEEAPTVVGGRLPHPIPYQGSKRQLAERILAFATGRYQRLFEPFAGSAAITIAAASRSLAHQYVISDTLAPLMALWRAVLEDPVEVGNRYEEVWTGQLDDTGHFNQVRTRFNRDGDPVDLLYLLARCVKNAPRFNGEGLFNQSADLRRRGMRPEKMRREVLGASLLLSSQTQVLSKDFRDVLETAQTTDLVYMDPPWQGTTYGTDKRYHAGLERDTLIDALHSLDERGVPYFLSYDGRCGDRHYGTPLPESVSAVRFDVEAGRSSQATLVGREDVTFESLYVSRLLLSD